MTPAPDELLASMPFATALGIEIDAATRDEVTGRLPWAADRCTIGGALHGGALMALADSLGAICAFLNLPDGATGTSTIESKTNFFRGVREGHVVATSRPLHVGRTNDRRADGPPRRRVREAGRPGHPDPGGDQPIGVIVHRQR